jgi:hypothetical protein
MNTLAEEVKFSFEKSRREVTGDSQFAVVSGDQESELAPGFTDMKTFYEHKLLVIMRRAYRHYAGSELPTQGDDLLTLTAEFLTPPMIAVSMSAFANGVMIGQQSDHKVKMCVHFDTVGLLFQSSTHEQAVMQMAKGFATDHEVCDYFNTYVTSGIVQISHATGFVHDEVNPAKVWDVWLLVGTACIAASYLAGHRMGASWRERDVLDGIEIASEAEGEDGSDY